MNTSLQQRIQSADLTRTEKRIADYFLDHSESLYFMTARDIAQELGVSDTSIIRLCRTLGYRGFRELQESQRAEPEKPRKPEMKMCSLCKRSWAARSNFSGRFFRYVS